MKTDIIEPSLNVEKTKKHKETAKKKKDENISKEKLQDKNKLNIKKLAKNNYNYNSTRSEMKLPKIKFKLFTGNVTKWSNFLFFFFFSYYS